MKKIIIMLLITICCFQLTISFAETPTETFFENPEENPYLRAIPFYYEMHEDRILIGESYNGIEIFEFENMNSIYDYSGCFRLLNPDEVEKELKRRDISYTSVSIFTVMAHDFLVITLVDGENYGLDLFFTSDDMAYVTMDSFRVFCMHYFGNGYDFYGT